MSEIKKTRHESYQEKCFQMYKKMAKLPGEATLLQAIEALVDTGHPREATEMLFGCERNGRVAEGRIGFIIYKYFWVGENPELLKEITRNHFWASNRPKEGFAVCVYPQEYLVIKEPTAAKVLSQALELKPRDKR